MANELTPMQELNKNLSRLDLSALPPHIDPKRFSAVAFTAIANSDLATKVKSGQINKASLYAACLDAARMGLLPDGKQGALIPYGKEVKFQPMYTGLLELVRNAAEVKDIKAEIVYEGDSFEYWEEAAGTNLKHHPFFGEGRGTPTHCYAIARMVNGGIYVAVMTREQIEDIRDKFAKGASSASSGWKTAPLEMWKKTAIRRMTKLMPQSTQMRKVVDIIDADFEVKRDPAPTPKALPTSARLEKALDMSSEFTEDDVPKETV